MLSRSILIQNQLYIIHTAQEFEDVIAKYLGDSAADLFRDLMDEAKDDND